MKSVHEAPQNATPEAQYREASSPAERKKISAAVLKTYEPRVARIVRARFRPEGWDDAQQCARIGILRALEAFDPEASAERGHSFWSFAMLAIRDELREWLEVGVYWDKRPHRAQSGEPAARVVCSTYEPEHDTRSTDETPETLLADAEAAALLEFCIRDSGMTPAQLATAYGRHKLVDRAGALFDVGL